MKVGRVVVWAGQDGTPNIGSVTEVKEDSLLATTGAGTPVTLPRGTAHKIKDPSVEALVSAFTKVPVPVFAYGGADYDDEEQGEEEGEEEEESEEED